MYGKKQKGILMTSAGTHENAAQIPTENQENYLNEVESCTPNDNCSSWDQLPIELKVIK